jgi:hypothetical protein
MNWMKPLLLLVALGHMILGLYGLYAPDSVAPMLGLETVTAGGRGELRAVFGGMVTAMGVAVLRGSMGGAASRQWLWTVATLYVGLAAGRVVSLGLDGLTAHTLFGGILEGGLAVVLYWCGMELGAARPSAGPSDPPVPAGD